MKSEEISKSVITYGDLFKAFQDGYLTKKQFSRLLTKVKTGPTPEDLPDSFKTNYEALLNAFQDEYFTGGQFSGLLKEIKFEPTLENLSSSIKKGYFDFDFFRKLLPEIPGNNFFVQPNTGFCLAVSKGFSEILNKSGCYEGDKLDEDALNSNRDYAIDGICGFISEISRAKEDVVEGEIRGKNILYKFKVLPEAIFVKYEDNFVNDGKNKDCEKVLFGKFSNLGQSHAVSDMIPEEDKYTIIISCLEGSDGNRVRKSYELVKKI